MKTPGAQSISPVTVTKLIRRLHGGSQSCVVECDDQKHYVLKFNGNPQGPNLLANEFLGFHVAHAVGIPVPQIKPLVIDRSFLKRHPDLCFSSKEDQYMPEPGIHFGSLLFGSTSGADRVLQWIRPTDIERISNRLDFLGMYLFDVWAMHADRREAVFIPDNSLRGLRNRRVKAIFGFFIDNGHLFGGPQWQASDRKYQALHLERSVYNGLWKDKSVQTWTKRFQKLIPGVLSSTIPQVPLDWYTGDIRVLADRLYSRLDDLEVLFESASLANKAARIPAITRHDDSWPVRRLMTIQPGTQ